MDDRRRHEPSLGHFNADGGRITDEQLLDHLRRLMERHGHLSMDIIDADPAIPTSQFFRRRFGGLKAAYARVGYLSDHSATVKAAMKRLAVHAAKDDHVDLPIEVAVGRGVLPRVIKQKSRVRPS